MTTTNKPLQKIELRPLIATIWAKPATTRDGVAFTSYNVDIQRRFLDDKTGEYRFTSSMRPFDIKNVALLAGMVEAYLKSVGAAVGPKPIEETAPEIIDAVGDDIPFHVGGVQ